MLTWLCDLFNVKKYDEVLILYADLVRRVGHLEETVMAFTDDLELLRKKLEAEALERKKASEDAVKAVAEADEAVATAKGAAAKADAAAAQDAAQDEATAAADAKAQTANDNLAALVQLLTTAGVLPPPVP